MPSSLTEILRNATETLRTAGVDNPSLDARLLTAHILQISRTDMMLDPARIVTDAQTTAIDNLIRLRAERKPVSRLIGSREFWGLSFGLNEATLDPRPDSETLIETTLRLLADKPPSRLLDLGTGTGCLLLSLLSEYKTASGLGIDIAPRAVEQATHNAENLGLESRAVFCVNDWLNGINEKFDLIISNPPYIETDVIGTLEPEVRLFDPLRALDGSRDGLAPYRHLIPIMAKNLTPDGLVVLEVGMGQAPSVAKLLADTLFNNITIQPDFGGIERCVAAFAPA